MPQHDQQTLYLSLHKFKQISVASDEGREGEGEIKIITNYELFSVIFTILFSIDVS